MTLSIILSVKGVFYKSLDLAKDTESIGDFVEHIKNCFNQVQRLAKNLSNQKYFKKVFNRIRRIKYPFVLNCRDNKQGENP